jgi:hypothetical protein
MNPIGNTPHEDELKPTKSGELNKIIDKYDRWYDGLDDNILDPDEFKQAIDQYCHGREIKARLVELDILEQYINRHFDPSNPFIVKLEQEYKLYRLKDLKTRLDKLQEQNHA